MSEYGILNPEVEKEIDIYICLDNIYKYIQIYTDIYRYTQIYTDIYSVYIYIPTLGPTLILYNLVLDTPSIPA